jgi:hypothetical protein
MRYGISGFKSIFKLPKSGTGDIIKSIMDCLFNKLLLTKVAVRTHIHRGSRSQLMLLLSRIVPKASPISAITISPLH